MLRPNFYLSIALLSLISLPAAAQQQPTPEELAIRAASPGVIVNEETGEYTAIELELQGCRIVQTLMTNQGHTMGGPVGVQVLRMDLRDLDPLTGILPAEDTVNGHTRVMLMPSQSAWEAIQTAGGIFSDMRTAAAEQGDQLTVAPRRHQHGDVVHADIRQADGAAARHQHVEKNDVIGSTPERLQRLGTCAGTGNLVAECHHRIGKRRQILRVVVGDQNPCHRSPPGFAHCNLP